MPVVSSLVTQPQGPVPVSNFLCDACKQHISNTSARVHCLACPDHDLCANCALGERFGDGHTAAHPTAVYRLSGDSTMPSIRSQASITYANLGASTTPTDGVPGSSHSGGTTSGGSTRATITSSSTSIATGVTAAASAHATGSPGIPTSSVSAGGTVSSISSGSTDAVAAPDSYGQHPSTAGAPPSYTAAPDGWSPFFYADMSSTPAFTALMHAVFAHLDPAATGFIPPEGCSRLLDDMGYPLQENIWKSNLANPMFGQTREGPADAALKRALDLFGIEHILRARAAPANSGPLKFLLPSGTAPMPLITPRGLADLMAIELLTDPAGAWQKLARVVQLYGLHGIDPYRQWGALPRSVLPPAPDPRMLARVAGAQAQSVNMANMSAQIQARANLAAVNAIGGTQYEYRYF